MAADSQRTIALEATDRLSRLPNELLDAIALGLCGSRDILDLACVNKRLCRVAQEAMMRRLCIPKGNGVQRVLEMLSSSNTEAISSVTHLDLIKMERMGFHDQARLFELLPSLTELTVWLNPHTNIWQTNMFIWPLLQHQRASYLLIVGPALKTLQSRLRILNIQSDPRFSGNGMARTIKLPGFRQLRSLTVAMEHLGATRSIRFYRSDGSLAKGKPENTSTTCLPLTLQNLHLTSCNRSAFSLIGVLDSFPPGESSLIHTTLAFEMSTTSTIVLCGSSHKKFEPLSKKVQSWLRRLMSLAQQRHRVEFFTKSSPSSFITELEAVTHLTNDEIAIAAGEGLQFSECVARSQDGRFRARSPAERKLFLLHGVKYRQLLCRSTFDFKFWTDTVFFHGNSGLAFGMGADATVFDAQKNDRCTHL